MRLLTLIQCTAHAHRAAAPKCYPHRGRDRVFKPFLPVFRPGLPSKLAFDTTRISRTAVILQMRSPYCGASDALGNTAGLGVLGRACVRLMRRRKGGNGHLPKVGLVLWANACRRHQVRKRARPLKALPMSIGHPAPACDSARLSSLADDAHQIYSCCVEFRRLIQNLASCCLPSQGAIGVVRFRTGTPAAIPAGLL